MKRYLIIATAVFLMMLAPATTLAQNQGTQGTGGDQQRVQDPTTHENGTPSAVGNQVQNQNQISTQNKGLETRLQVANQQMTNLMSMEGLSEEVAGQVSQLAQQQRGAQVQIEQDIDVLGARQGFMKTLFGPDYGAIKSLKQQAEQNQLRINQLEQIKTMIADEADQDQIQVAIQALTEQNTALAEQIQTEEETTSLLGWLFRLFAK